MAAANAALYDTPIGRTVDALQDVGRNIWIAGFTSDGRRALIVDAGNGVVTTAHVDTVNGIGRWECTIIHWRHHAALYTERYPQR